MVESLEHLAAERIPRTATALRYAACVLLSISIGAVCGWIAFALQQSGSVPAVFFPLLFPLIVGTIGGSIATLVTQRFVRKLPAAISFSLVACVSILSAESWFSYRHYAQEVDGIIDRNPKAAMFRAADGKIGPTSFGEFVRLTREKAGPWWYIDVALTLIAGGLAATAFAAQSQPLKSQHE